MSLNEHLVRQVLGSTVGPDILARIVALHLRLVEALVHGWDLAWAIGEIHAVFEDLALKRRLFAEPRQDVPHGRR